MRGIIEGFYGPPWTWEERRALCAVLAGAGMDTYVYAPKDDPLHRDRWREPYPPSEMAGFASLVADGTLRVGFGISPGLSIDPASHGDRVALLGKIQRMQELGISLVGLLLDDLEPEPGLGGRHGELTAWLRGALDPELELFLVPTHYTGIGSAPYLDQLVAHVPHDVPIAWTGRYVVNRQISAAEAASRAAALGGRRPLLWDNTPVNDAVMEHHLFTGPLRGRDPELLGELSGYLANTMVQAHAGLAALLSIAAWLRGEDPEAAWRTALEDHGDGPRALLEGCDGAVPAALADAGLAGCDSSLAELEEWFCRAERCEADSFGAAVEPWARQLRAEAAVGRVAVQVLRADPGAARRLAPLLYLLWPRVREGACQVLGGRGALLPAMGQDEESQWIASAESFVEAASVTDRLVRAAFDHLGAGEGP